MTIDTLIDKLDTFEIVRNQIAQILADEVASQMALATTATKDPELWDMTIFAERFNPWELLRDSKSIVPVVNVWYDRSTFNKSASNVVARQQTDGVFNIDIVANGNAADDGAGGHTPGDKDAITNVQRGARLARNIIMSANYTYLDLRGIVGRRWIANVQSFQPDQGNQASPRAAGMRITLNAVFDEFSPQFTPEVLEGVDVTIKRDTDGKVLAKMEFPES